MKKTHIIILLFLTCLISSRAQDSLKSQDIAKKEYQQMYEKFSDYDSDRNYRQMILELTGFIDSYPDYKQAGKILTQILRRYKDEITLDGEILAHVLNYKEFVPPDFIGVLLVAYYRDNNIQKVQELLAILTTADTSVYKLQMELLLLLDPKANEELYQQIILNVKPLISFSPEPEKYVLYYNSGLLNEINRIYSGQSPSIPLNLLAKINPELSPELYFAYFAESLPDNAEVVIDSVSNNDELFNMLLQFNIMDRSAPYEKLKSYLIEKNLNSRLLYKLIKHLFVQDDLTDFDRVQRRINDQINSSDTEVALKFNWAVSAIYLKQTFRSNQLLMQIFLYGKPKETEYYKNEIEWWISKKFEPVYCREFLAGIYGEKYSNPDNTYKPPAQVNIKPAEKDFGVYHAFLIGVQDYEDDMMADLIYPISDGKRLQDLLINHYQFNSENIVFLENPRREEIIKQFYEYRKKLGENDNLLVFFAGHGTWDDEIEQGYWLPSDASLDNKSNWINNSAVRDYIKSIQTKHTLLITDACFSGGIFKQRDIKPLSDQNMEFIYSHISRKAITSGSLKEVPDQSVFIEWLLKRLNDNEKKYLTAADLFFSLKDAVRNNSPQVPQYGTIHNSGDDDLGDFIFVKK